MSDDPTRSPALLGPLPKRGPGVRRLNRVPVWIAAGGVCSVIAAVGYTYKARLEASVAQQREQESGRGEGAIPAVLNGAPKGNEIQSGRQSDAQSLQGRHAGQTHKRQASASSPISSPPPTSRRRMPRNRPASRRGRPTTSSSPPCSSAAARGTERHEGGHGAQRARRPAAGPQRHARTGSAGGRGAGYGAPVQGSGGLDASRHGAATRRARDRQRGYPILPPAGPDPAGAREKQAFTGQAGNLGQNDTLAATVRDPISPYLVTAGDVIPCVAQGGEDSDTPGQFVGRVSRNVYDSATGRFLLIPQNSKVIGSYDNVVTNGQSRIPTVITRIIFPDSSSIPIGAMPAADQGGFAGLHDQVDTASLGEVRQRRHPRDRQRRHPAQPGQRPEHQRLQFPADRRRGNRPAVRRAGAGVSPGRACRSPTPCAIRPGYSFVVQVTKDMVLRPYVDRRTAGAAVQPVRLGPVMQ